MKKQDLIDAVYDLLTKIRDDLPKYEVRELERMYHQLPLWVLDYEERRVERKCL